MVSWYSATLNKHFVHWISFEFEHAPFSSEDV